MNQTESWSIDRIEGVKLPPKSVWKSYRLDQGDAILGEGVQGAAIFILLKGAIQIFSPSEEKMILLQEADICLLSASPPYMVKVEEGAHILLCVFDLDIFPFDREMLETLHPFYLNENSGEIVIKANEMVGMFASLMDEYLQRGLGSDLLFENKRQELFVLLFATYPAREIAMFFNPITGSDFKFKEFVVSNYLNAKSVQQLAQMANYSTSGFIKKFSRLFHESPYQWMLRRKAKVILDDIRSSQVPMIEIAFKYNFSAYQHFVEFCKKQFGVIPSKLR